MILTPSVFLQRITRLFFFPLLLLSGTECGRIKRSLKAWWSAGVEGVVSERRKAFAAAHRSDGDR